MKESLYIMSKTITPTIPHFFTELAMSSPKRQTSMQRVSADYTSLGRRFGTVVSPSPDNST